MSDLVEIARISGPHGLKGLIKIIPFSGSFDDFIKYTHLIIGTEGIAIEVLGALNRGKFYIIELKGFTHISQVEPLKGETVYVRRSQLQETVENEFYWRDLIGLTVIDTEGKTLGELINIFSTGSNDVYVVDRKRQYYIPATKDVIKDISLADGIMVIDASLLEGLLD